MFLSNNYIAYLGRDSMYTIEKYNEENKSIDQD